MKYNITKKQHPQMPTLGKGTECIKLLLSQTSKDMHQPIVPMLFPILGAHLSGTEFLYPDQSWKEPTGMLANLVAESGGNKGKQQQTPNPRNKHHFPHQDLRIRRTGTMLQGALGYRQGRLALVPQRDCLLPGTCATTARPGLPQGPKNAHATHGAGHRGLSRAPLLTPAKDTFGLFRTFSDTFGHFRTSTRNLFVLLHRVSAVWGE